MIELSTAAGKTNKLTCVQNHFNHQRPKLSKFRHGHVAQDETVIVLHRPEKSGHMVVLQDRPVVVHEGKAGV